MQAELQEFVTEFPASALPVVMDVVLRRGTVTKHRAALALSNVILYAEGQIIPNDPTPVMVGDPHVAMSARAAKPVPTDAEFEQACNDIKAAHAARPAGAAAMAAPQAGGAWLVILTKLLPIFLSLFA